MKLTITQVKEIIESEGLDFKEQKDALYTQILTEVGQKTGIYTEIVNTILTKQAEEILIKNLGKKTKSESTNNNSSNSNSMPKDEQTKLNN